MTEALDAGVEIVSSRTWLNTLKKKLTGSLSAEKAAQLSAMNLIDFYEGLEQVMVAFDIDSAAETSATMRKVKPIDENNMK